MAVRFAKKHRKPCLVVDLSKDADVSLVQQWIAKHKIEALNVAGPRGSKQPEVYGMAVEFLQSLFSA